MSSFFSFLSSISIQSRVKYISLSLVGVSAAAGITCEELSGAKISGLLNKLVELIPWEELRGGQEISKGISTAFNVFGETVSGGAQQLYWLGDQVVSYFPRAIDMIDSLFQTGMKYTTETESLSTKWGSVYSILKTKDTTTVINNWIKCFLDWERLLFLIKLPIKIFMTLNKVELNTNLREPKPKKTKSTRSGEEIWARGKDQDGNICWECFGIVLLRPRKSLKEIKQINKGVWTIYPM